MKVIVFSDSHSDTEAMFRATELEAPDFIFHLGDCYSDFLTLRKKFPQIESIGVLGNCDREKGVSFRTLCIDGIPFFFTHGHQYHVKSGLMSLYYAALEQNARIALYGHTHIPQINRFASLTLLNPGTIGRGIRKTYAVIETDNGTFNCRIVEIAG